MWVEWTYRYTLLSHSPIPHASVGDDRLLADYQAIKIGTEVAVIYSQHSPGWDEANSLGNVHTSFTKFESTVSQTGQKPNNQ
jgi:hypothetical protein